MWTHETGQVAKRESHFFSVNYFYGTVGPRASGGLEPAAVGSRRSGKGIYRTAAYPGGIRLSRTTKEMTGTKGNGAELIQTYNSTPLVFPTGTPGG